MYWLKKFKIKFFNKTMFSKWNNLFFLDFLQWITFIKITRHFLCNINSRMFFAKKLNLPVKYQHEKGKSLSYNVGLTGWERKTWYSRVKIRVLSDFDQKLWIALVWIEFCSYFFWNLIASFSFRWYFADE